ncbi:MAG: hypothetical protein AB1394_01775 [Bacteroidota bacterium]
MQLGGSSNDDACNGAHSFDMAQLKLRKEIVVVAPLFLPRVGMCAPPRENLSFFPKGCIWDNGVLTLSVMCIAFTDRAVDNFSARQN